MADKMNTKKKIFDIAVEMFSESNYDNVSIRDIAARAGIKPSSIYNYYSSKSEIIDDIYNFYTETQKEARPDLNMLLKMAETENPHDVLMKTNFHYDPSLQTTMDRIIVIASLENRRDKRSAELIKENIFNLVHIWMGGVLRKMLELERIEPLDVDAYLVLYTNFCYSAALRNYTSYPVTMEEWYKGVSLILSFIRPTGK